MTIPEITPTEGAALVSAGAFLLDVREADEWAAGRSPDANWIALGTLASRIAEIPSGRRIVCICRRGGRSMQAARLLTDSGLDVVNLAGGMRAWADAGLAVVDERGAPGSVL